MIFVTVGTSFPFDRLIYAVEAAVRRGLITEEITAQVGIGGYRPKVFTAVESLDKKEYDRCFEKADYIVAHAGMGTISMACQLQKPILVMPRQKCYRELVNDHQMETAHKFEALGHVLAAYDEEDLFVKISRLKSFVPVQRKSQPEKLAECVHLFLLDMVKEK